MCSSGERRIRSGGGRSDGDGQSCGRDDDGGLPEVVARGETGLLVLPGYVESLAATVASWMTESDESGWAVTGRRARRSDLDSMHPSITWNSSMMKDWEHRRLRKHSVARRNEPSLSCLAG